jgi:hypothetical protein
MTEKNKPFAAAFDFDGVLVEYDFWRGHRHYGRPIFQGLRLLRALKTDGCRIIIFTTRLNPYATGVFDPEADSKENKERLWDWFGEHGVRDCISEITGRKPVADVYIDDRGVRYHRKLTASDVLKKAKEARNAG